MTARLSNLRWLPSSAQIILLAELEAAPSYDHTWIPKFQELHKRVQTHAASEENELYRKTDVVMTPQEAENLV